MTRLPIVVVLLALALSAQADEALVDAIDRSDIEAARTRLAAGASVHETSGERGRTPLLLAARVGNPDMVRLLIDAGADLDFQDTRGSTALHIAVHRQHLEIVKLLIERGANPRLKNAKEHTPVYNAKRRAAEEPDNPRRREIAAYLAGSDYNYTSRMGGVKSLIKRGQRPAPVIIDVAGGLSPDEFRWLVRPVLVDRGWRIEEETATRMRGMLRKMAETYKVDVELVDHRIVIGFVKNFHIDRDKWLRYLERDIRAELSAPRYRPPVVTGSQTRSPDAPVSAGAGN